MSQKKYTRSELLSKSFLKKSQIRVLLGCTTKEAEKIYQVADRIDGEELKDRRISQYPRLKSVLKASGTDYSLLTRQIKNAEPA